MVFLVVGAALTAIVLIFGLEFFEPMVEEEFLFLEVDEWFILLRLGDERAQGGGHL